MDQNINAKSSIEDLKAEAKAIKAELAQLCGFNGQPAYALAA